MLSVEKHNKCPSGMAETTAAEAWRHHKDHCSTWHSSKSETFLLWALLPGSSKCLLPPKLQGLYCPSVAPMAVNWLLLQGMARVEGGSWEGGRRGRGLQLGLVSPELRSTAWPAKWEGKLC